MKSISTSLTSICLLLSVCLLLSCKGQEQTNGSQESPLEHQTVPQDASSNDIPVGPPRRKPMFEQIHTNLDGRVSEFVRKMFQDRNGNYWFGTNGDGVIRYDGDSLTQFTRATGFGGTAVRGIVEDEAGNVWFGTSGGLTKFDGKTFTNFSVPEGLIDEEIWGLTIDRKGMIWVGTVEGVSQFDGKTFTDFPLPKATVSNPEPMLSPNRVSTILEDRDGKLWFVTDGYGITIYDGKEFTHLTKANGLPDDQVADLLEDKQGNIWIGTFYGGVSRYTPSSGATAAAFVNFTEDGIIEGVEAYNFCEDRQGNIWFAVEHVGVYRYDGKAFTKFTTEEGLTTNGVQSIYEDQEGRLWFGTWSGLSLYDGTSISDAKEKAPWTK